MEALCEAEGINVSSITGDLGDRALSPSTQSSMSETSSLSDGAFGNVKN
jgi:hypothetical protein